VLVTRSHWFWPKKTSGGDTKLAVCRYACAGQAKGQVQYVTHV
jgi:hypothetical protein